MEKNFFHCYGYVGSSVLPKFTINSDVYTSLLYKQTETTKITQTNRQKNKTKQSLREL